MRGIAIILHYTFSFYELGLLAYVLCGWIAYPGSRRVRFCLAPWYEPMLSPIRRFLLLRVGFTGLDLSPILLFAALALLKRVVISLLIPGF
jgi:uncharacterized protein YggT (Ycf19 family)